MDDVVEQLGCLFCCRLDMGFEFDPLRKLVNAGIDPVETSWHKFERPDHVKSLACKGPRSRNYL